MGMLFAYACVATILAQALGAAYMWRTGKLSRDKLFQMLAIVHDVPLSDGSDRRSSDEDSRSQSSFDEIEQQRAVRARLLELKQQFLDKGLEQVRFERLQLSEDKTRHQRIKMAFEEKLAALRDRTLIDGYSNVRLIWENILPKQATQQIMKMIEADEIEDVVVILSDMPISKRAKIVKAFTSPEQIEAMDEILRLIRKGAPQSTLIDETRKRLQRR
jgi:hypothetical protein